MIVINKGLYSLVSTRNSRSKNTRPDVVVPNICASDLEGHEFESL